MQSAGRTHRLCTTESVIPSMTADKRSGRSHSEIFHCQRGSLDGTPVHRLAKGCLDDDGTLRISCSQASERLTGRSYTVRAPRSPPPGNSRRSVCLHCSIVRALSLVGDDILNLCEIGVKRRKVAKLFQAIRFGLNSTGWNQIYRTVLFV